MLHEAPLAANCRTIDQRELPALDLADRMADDFLPGRLPPDNKLLLITALTGLVKCKVKIYHTIALFSKQYINKWTCKESFNIKERTCERLVKERSS